MRRFIFFFQAEDGIRDIGVTGVQTCALPISGRTILDDTPEQWRRAKTSFGSDPAGEAFSGPIFVEIGRAAGRGRVEISVGAVLFKKKTVIIAFPHMRLNECVAEVFNHFSVYL